MIRRNNLSVRTVSVAEQLMSPKAVQKQQGCGRSLFLGGVEKVSPGIGKPVVLGLVSPPRCDCGGRVIRRIDI
jgi:hypothetical protein